MNLKNSPLWNMSFDFLDEKKLLPIDVMNLIITLILQ